MMLKRCAIIGLTFFLVGFITNSLEAQQPIKMGKVKTAVLNEISGIVPSVHNDHYFWVHNDSGDMPNIYLIDSLAQLKSTIKLEGIDVVDVEDIASLMIDSIPYLLLADMGNNLKDRDTMSLFLFKEPDLNLNKDFQSVAREDITEIRFRYRDKRRDAEALFVDPIDNTVYIISKRDFKSTLFKLSLSKVNDGSVQELSPLVQLPLTFATAADIRQDGRYIIVKNLTSIFLWERGENQSVPTALQGNYRRIPYEVEPQGEAVCFGRNNFFFYTISERPFGLDAYLYKYEY